MVQWLNRVVIGLARNGTTVHTVNPASSGTVLEGTAFAPTAGRVLVAHVVGAVTSTGTAGGTGTTPPTGWTLNTGMSSVVNSGVYVFMKTAAGSDTIILNHNGGATPGYPVIVEFLEFPAGTTFVKAGPANNSVVGAAANAAIAATIGTHTLLATIAGYANPNTSAGAVVAGPPTYSGAPTPVALANERAVAATTDGYGFVSAYADDTVATSWTPTISIALESGIPTKETVSYALNIPTGGTSGNVTAVVATITALAPIPTVTGASNVSGGGVATATMQAIAPVVTGVSAGIVTAVVATVNALAPVPVITGLQTSTVVAVRGIVTSLALPPTVTGLITASIVGTPATVTTLALSPVVAGSVTGSVSAVVATASALALPPIVSAGGVANVSAVTATASTLAPAPVVTGLRVASVVAVRGIVTALALPPVVSASSSANVTAVPAVATVQAIAPTVTASSGSLVLAVVALATMRAYVPSVSPAPSVTFEFDYRTSSWVGDAGTNQTWKPLEGPDTWV